ncbi:MAG: ThuA domain-containing protein [Acidobacteriota bacterium]
MNTFRRLMLLPLVVGVVAVVTLTVHGANKTLVLLAGRASHGPGQHEFRAGSLLFQKALAGVTGLTVEVVANGWPTKTVDGQVVDDNTVLEKADAILVYADGGRGNPAIQGNRIAVLDALAAKGVGLGFAHYGVEFPVGAGADAMLRWTGGYYEDRYSVNPMWSPQYQTFPAHPITRGVLPFSNRDEWYFNMRWTNDAAAKARVTPLLTATPSDDVRKGPYVSPPGPYPHIVADSGKIETLMWAYERPNGGRSFAFTGGHTHKNWGDVNQRRVMLNALLWMSKIDVPATGVVDRITDADLEMNLDPKGK